MPSVLAVWFSSLCQDILLKKIQKDPHPFILWSELVHLITYYLFKSSSKTNLQPDSNHSGSQHASWPLYILNTKNPHWGNISKLQHRLERIKLTQWRFWNWKPPWSCKILEWSFSLLQFLATEISPSNIMLCSKIMCSNWSPATIGVELWNDFLLFQFLQQWCE